MHKRMRRGKEMYPSFDTRRVLCKQHRPYCVKPLRARLKPSNASNAASTLRGLKTGQTLPGRLKSIALCLVPTRTQDESLSTGVWSAMCRLALALMLRQCWREGQKAVLANGGKSTGLKQPLHHHLDGYHWKSAPRGRNIRLLCGSRGRGTKQTGQFAGQNIQNTKRHWLLLLTTTTTNKTKKGQGSTQEKRGTSKGKMSHGCKVAESLLVNTERNIPNDAKSAVANGEATIQISGKNAKKGGGRFKKQIQCGGPCTIFARGSERCSRASVVRVLRSDAAATSSCNTSNLNSPMKCIGTTTEIIGTWTMLFQLVISICLIHTRQKWQIIGETFNPLKQRRILRSPIRYRAAFSAFCPYRIKGIYSTLGTSGV